MLRRLAPVLGAGLLASAGAGCLPGDERPTPASLELAARSAPDSSAGFVTDDGWQIEFERLLGGLGTVRLQGDGCNPYNQAWYSRVFDFALPLDEPSKVALVHGIGDCRLEFRLRAPQDDSILTEGVSVAEVDAMRVEQYDIWVNDSERVSLRVRGKATKDDRVKTFEWAFRARYDITDCLAPEGGVPFLTDLDLQSDAALERTIDVDASALFRVPARRPPDYEEGDPVTEDPAAGVPTRFEMFANGDGSSPEGATSEDGDISLFELFQIDADTGERIPAIGEVGPPAEELPRRRLSDVLYYRMVPAIVRLDGNACRGRVDD